MSDRDPPVQRVSNQQCRHNLCLHDRWPNNSQQANNDETQRMRQIEVEDGRVGNVQCKWVGGGGETESERRNRVKSKENVSTWNFRGRCEEMMMEHWWQRSPNGDKRKEKRTMYSADREGK